MLDYYRKTSEVISLYFLHENISDYYVEGITDLHIIENYLEYKEIDATVIEINSVDFSDITDDKFALNLNSNRNRLIILSKLFSENAISSKVKCIIDKDFDDINGVSEVNKYIIQTDFSCMESYFFSKNC